MKTQAKAIIALVTLVCSCVLCIWLGPYIWYFFLVFSLSHGTQGRMHCWIKVVNQNSEGVAGYKCRVVQEHSSWWPFSEGNDIVRIFETGSDGSFEYKSKGSTGRVFFGYGTGIQWTLDPRHLIDETHLGVYTFKLNEAKEKDPANYLGSHGNPYLLHVFSVGPPQKLLYWHRRLKLKDKNDYVCVNILSGKIWESQRPAGDIAMQDHPYEGKKEVPCTITFVSGRDCALYPVVDDWALGPPENGYLSELCRPTDWDVRRKRGTNTIQVYYRLRKEGEKATLYGKLNFGASHRVNRAILESYTNLQGKRNLYFKGYEKSVMTYEPGQIENYVSPPVNLSDLPIVSGKGK